MWAQRSVLGGLAAAACVWLSARASASPDVVSGAADGIAVPGAASPAPTPMSSNRVQLLLPASSGRIRLAAATLHQGSTREEISELAAECNRRAGAEVCRPSTFAHELRTRPEIFVPAFALDRLEVSLGAYLRCVRSGRCAPPRVSSPGDEESPLELPAVGVTRADAAMHCAFAGGRLPREDELERAARGASGRRYPWGALFHTGRVNGGAFGVAGTERADGYERLAPVAAFSDGRTPEGILQLSGNVEEWTADGDEPDSASAGMAAVRGGHFASPPHELRAAARRIVPVDSWGPSLGFRCAHDVRGRRQRTAAK